MDMFPKTFAEYIAVKKGTARPIAFDSQEHNDRSIEIQSCHRLAEVLRNNLHSKAGVLPYGDIVSGKYGYLIYWPDDDGGEETIELESRIFPEAVQVLCDTVEEFKKALEENVAKNYYMDYSDDPRNLRLGFVVVKGDGNVHYLISLRTLKAGHSA